VRGRRRPGQQGDHLSGSQAPFITRNGIARLIGLREQDVHFVLLRGVGLLRRLEPDDAPEDAALMSQAVGKPVRVQWMREDEHGWEPKGPPQLITIRSGLDAQATSRRGTTRADAPVDRCAPDADARLEADGHQAGRERHRARRRRRRAVCVLESQGGDGNHPWVMTPNPLRTANLRAPYSAGALLCRGITDGRHGGRRRRRSGGVPPALSDGAPATSASRVLRAGGNEGRVQPRARGADARGRRTLETRNTAPARGVAISGMAGTVVAQIADVDVERSTGKVMVRKVTVAHDCGIIVNPDGLKNQIEGNVIQGTAAR